MNHTDPRQIASWVKTIHNYINSFTKRPKRIMVFVNPYGGKKKGLQIYEKRVMPLFELAGVHTTITITQSANHARDTLLSCSFDNIDAITCVGGDGTFAEVFNGLVLRTAKDKGIDQNDPEAILPTPSLRVGIIPAGSTDTMAYCFHGTTDVQTAVLLIIFGDSVGLDLCSVHSNATLLRYYSSVISYGYLGDVVRDSERFRWMGPKRYDYSGFKKFFANVGYDGEVSLLSDSSDPSKGPKCKDNCERCNKKQHKGQKIKEASAGDWKTFRGKFFMINGANVSCACVRSPNGISPYGHLGDGCIDVLLIKHTNLLNNLRLLLTLTSKEKTLFIVRESSHFEPYPHIYPSQKVSLLNSFLAGVYGTVMEKCISGTGMGSGVTDASACTGVSIVLCLFHLAAEMGRRASLGRLLEVRVSEEGQSCADKWPKSPEVSHAASMVFGQPQVKAI
uniref:DAGKc domain-containing protein n=1 Tax=Timema poppense TaxID=170557 RepID=A0A7R9H4B9_TIMPO|nr:unnamed protein product [Timema poppensis]